MDSEERDDHKSGNEGYLIPAGAIRLGYVGWVVLKVILEGEE